MKVALFGNSLVGKSTAARELVQQLSLPVRHCGEIVRQRAATTGLSLSEISDTVHSEIDAETREWIGAQAAGFIVEGRFLDAVLDPAKDLMFIQLSARADVRAARGGLSVQAVEERDAFDREFRARVFTAPPSKVSCIAIDTSEMSVLECAREVIRQALAA